MCELWHNSVKGGRNFLTVFGLDTKVTEVCSGSAQHLITTSGGLMACRAVILSLLRPSTRMRPVSTRSWLGVLGLPVFQTATVKGAPRDLLRKFTAQSIVDGIKGENAMLLHSVPSPMAVKHQRRQTADRQTGGVFRS